MSSAMGNRVYPRSVLLQSIGTHIVGDGADREVDLIAVGLDVELSGPEVAQESRPEGKPEVVQESRPEGFAGPGAPDCDKALVG